MKNNINLNQSAINSIFTEEKQHKTNQKTPYKKTSLAKRFPKLFLGTIIVSSIIITIAGVLFLTILLKKPKIPSTLLTTQNYIATEQNISIQSENPYKTIAVGQPKTEESPLNGTLWTKKEIENLKQKRPIAIMINNHVLARPQSNLPKADIIYETMAEGGITRLMAIFWSHDVNKVGPIRSARQYYIEWLSEYDALYVHDGYAFSDDPRVDARRNLVRYNIKDIANRGAWRVNDGTRFAPHNEYISPIKVWSLAKNYGWDGFPNITPWSFKNDNKVEDRGPGKGAKIVFWQGLSQWNSYQYDVVWKYDANQNSYKRWSGGKPDIDLETGQQISAKVIILQKVEMIPTYDHKAHVIITTIGNGDAFIMQDGSIIPAKWSKKDRTSRTMFTDEKGNPIRFNRGLIWISAVPRDQGKITFVNAD